MLDEQDSTFESILISQQQTNSNSQFSSNDTDFNIWQSNDEFRWTFFDEIEANSIGNGNDWE